MFKKIMCSTLIAWCVMSPSNLFSMKKELARLNAQAKTLKAELTLARLQTQAHKLEAELAQDSNEKTDVKPAKKATTKTRASKAKGKKAAPTVQPDANRVLWTIAGIVSAPAGCSALFYTDDFLPKLLFCSACAYATYRGIKAIRDICQADIKPAWDKFKGWFPTK